MSCDRAQEWASLDLDGELSQLERALLRSHLRRCDACAVSAAEMRTFTHALRAAPLESPSRPIFVAREPARAGRGRTVAVRLALAASLAALAAGLGVFAGSLGADGDSPAQTSDAEIALLPSQDEQRDTQRLRMTDEPLGDERLLPAPRPAGV